MKETLIIEVTVHIDYNEGHRERVIKEALDFIVSDTLHGNSSISGKYTVEPVGAKALYIAPMPVEKAVENCKYFVDMGQGRHNCTIKGFFPKKCQGVCKDFKEK